MPTTARPRSCDALGACKTINRLHRVSLPHNSQRIACTADLCRQGRAACPCPQACELPAPDADPQHDEPATRTEIVLMCIAIAAVAVVLLFAIKACAIA